jgi:hypothetical protein
VVLRLSVFPWRCPMMKWFDFHGHRKKDKKEMVQDAFIALIPPLLMLVGMLIASFVSHHPH